MKATKVIKKRPLSRKIKKMRGGADDELIKYSNYWSNKLIPIEDGTPQQDTLKIVEFTKENAYNYTDFFAKGAPFYGLQENVNAENRFQYILNNISYLGKGQENMIVFMKNWNLTNEATVLVLGDVHGKIEGLANLFADWKKEGFMKSDCTLKENVYVISLGDLIDYGDNSLGVLNVMLQLREKNNTDPKNEKVMLLCGNHEGAYLQKYNENPESPHHGFAPGISGKNLDDKISNVHDEFFKEVGVEKFKQINELTRFIGPSMLMLRFSQDNGYYSMMHGMYPVICKNKEINQKVLKLLEEGRRYINEISIDDIAIWPETKDIPIVATKEISFNEVVQWNDIGEEKETFYGVRRILGGLTLGYDLLTTIMNKHQIKAFIRGHQDGCPTQYGYKESCKYDEGGLVTHNHGTCHDHSDVINSDTFCTKKITIEGRPDTLSNKDVETRVITTSMAYVKAKRPTAAAPGAYIVIRPNTGGSVPVAATPPASATKELPAAPVSMSKEEKEAFIQRVNTHNLGYFNQFKKGDIGAGKIYLLNILGGVRAGGPLLNVTFPPDPYYQEKAVLAYTPFLDASQKMLLTGQTLLDPKTVLDQRQKEALINLLQEALANQFKEIIPLQDKGSKILRTYNEVALAPAPGDESPGPPLRLLDNLQKNIAKSTYKDLIKNIDTNLPDDTAIIDAYLTSKGITDDSRKGVLRAQIQEKLHYLSFLLIRPVQGITSNPQKVFLQLSDQEKQWIIGETVKVMGELVNIVNNPESHLSPPPPSGGGAAKKHPKRRVKGGFQEMDVAKMYNAQGLVTDLDTSLSQHLITNANVYPNPFSAGGLTQSSEGIDANLATNIKADIVPSYNGGNKKPKSSRRK